MDSLPHLLGSKNGYFLRELMKSIAILNISLGKYDVLWSEFYESCENLFCKEADKTYFVFTDSNKIKADRNVIKVDQDDWGWPFNSMYRYKMFKRLLNNLKKFDYIVFMNGNCQVVEKINISDFFGHGQQLVAALHSGYWKASPDKFTTERRMASSAFIKKPIQYFQGAINGGSSEKFIEAIIELMKMIEEDLSLGIMAVWHDESYWNAYIHQKLNDDKNSVHILSPAYLYPEGSNLELSPKITLRNKSRYLDVVSVKPEVVPKKLNLLEKIYRKIN